MKLEFNRLLVTCVIRIKWLIYQKQIIYHYSVEILKISRFQISHTGIKRTITLVVARCLWVHFGEVDKSSIRDVARGENNPKALARPKVRRLVPH